MSSKKEIAISVKDLHKTFKLPHEQHSGIKQGIINIFRRNRKKGYEIQHVLKGLDFEIEKGDFFGIVGRNGSGKSTLLKTLAGIYNPDKGAVQVNGTLVPFIELGVGFNPELTGRENVFLNGALLGFSREEMEAMYDDIVEFAELSKFMDQKLKNYSSGMQVRLAFSIAIRADADILLLDEVLAVGDEAFQRKCNDYFDTLKRKKKTVILVTHSMSDVRRYCNKALMIRDGRVVAFGDPDDVSNEYSLENIDASKETSQVNKRQAKREPSRIKDFKIVSTQKRILTSQDSLKFKIEFENTSNQTVSKVRMGLHAYDTNRSRIILDTKSGLDLRAGKKTLSYKLPLKNINQGDFFIAASVWGSDDKMIAWVPESGRLNFCIRNKKEAGQDSLLREKGEWLDE